jgi:KDO2-lipid IV(A) lauroyltransferase
MIKRKSKSKALQILEYLAFSVTLAFARLLPFMMLKALCSVLGNFLYIAFSRRRNIAVQNIRIAFGDRISDKEIRQLARQSCKVFFLTAVEIIKSPFLRGDIERALRLYKIDHLESLFLKAKAVHDQAGGCIFVTPHLGNWEMLPFISTLIGIRLAIVMRPLDNPYLERALLTSRIGSGHLMIPKMNAMFSLDRMLRKGISIAMLPDQRHSKGLRIEFFGKIATVNPVPALLAIRHGRPVIVVAACRTSDPRYFEGFVSDPIWPDLNADERSETERITREINREMEEVIRRFPEQYLWMHDRWKISHKKPIFGNR